MGKLHTETTQGGIGTRIDTITSYFLINAVKFAKLLNITPSSLSRIRHQRQKLTPAMARAIVNTVFREYSAMIDENWLLTGEGEMFKKESVQVKTANNAIIASSGSGKEKDANQEIRISEMLTKTAEILESKTTYRLALAANITAFYQAVTAESDHIYMKERLAQAERDNLDIKNRMAQLEEKFTALQQGNLAGEEKRAV